MKNTLLALNTMIHEFRHAIASILFCILSSHDAIAIPPSTKELLIDPDSIKSITTNVAPSTTNTPASTPAPKAPVISLPNIASPNPETNNNKRSAIVTPPSKKELLIDPDAVKAITTNIAPPTTNSPAKAPVVSSPNIASPTPESNNNTNSAIVIPPSKKELLIAPDALKPITTNVAPPPTTNKPANEPSPKAPAVVLPKSVTPTPENNHNPHSANPAHDNASTETPILDSQQWTGSLMFDQASIEKLKKALALFYNHKDDGPITASKSQTDNTPQISSILDLTAKNDISPSFYLGAILYRSANDWTIWINNTKLEAEKSKQLKFLVPALEVVTVSEKAVTFLWRTPYLDSLSPDWRSKLPNSTGKSHELYAAGHEILAKDDGSVVKFTIRPNQSFVLHSMDIAEGYVPDHKIIVENTSKPGQN